MTAADKSRAMSLDTAILWGLHQFTCWGVLATDVHLTITGWNQWLEKHSGRRADEVVGRNLLEVLPELKARRLDRLYRQALNGQVVFLSQRLHKHLIRLASSVPDCPLSEMRQSVHIAPLVEGEQVVGTLTLIEDVTERVAYEEELGARARQQAAIALLGQRALAGGDLPALMAKIITVVTETIGVEVGEILEATSAGSEGLVVRAAVGRSGADNETRAAGPGSALAHVLSSGEAVVIEDVASERRFATAGLAALGAVCCAAVRVSAGEGTYGVLAVYAANCRDFTEDHVQFLQAAANVLGMAVARHRLETALRARVEELATADRRKDEFLAMLGHELRNPLAPIRNATRVLELKASPDPETRWAQGIIERQVQHMSRLVDDLLDVSRITRGKVNFHKVPVDLATVVARAVETSRPLIDSRKHKFTLNLPAEPLRLEADVARLAQVLANLLNNAAKYTPEGGRIWLTAAREGSEIVVSVRDTGVGIPQELLPSIFDLFMQVNCSIDRSEGGLGIGLTLVRSLVALHGGSVSVASEGPGRGSEFTVRLPALSQDLGAPAGTSVSPGQGPLAEGARRILVVDDNRDSAESLALLLRLTGHEVRTAHDGPEALRAAREFSPAVVLLDIGLPGMSGIDVARQLRQDMPNKQALLLAMTGYGQEEDRRRSEAAGFNAHLVKPIDLEELQTLLGQFSTTGGPLS